MYEILCYGDSNTWGYIPGSGDRYHRDVRWTGIMRSILGSEYHIIEEGLNGRTTVWDDPVEGHKNGKTYLYPCLESHKPLSLVIIMLGTNDLKTRYSVPAFDIALSVGVLVDIIQKSGSGGKGKIPEVLLLAPPPLGRITAFAEMLEGGNEKSEKFGDYYEGIAKEYGCHFFNSGTIIKSSDIDGVHLTEESHKIFGERIAALAEDILGV